ncbi:hypothetical protein [Kribbella antiqua]|uniref:hypothetical protein n=1 Tax=Kribbella antiqua TaxID=2512217 RepID=UPI0010489FFD|nr:hypothetical protein [Kribbella antiqua]
MDRAEGCTEAIDWEFLRYIWRYRRGPAKRLQQALTQYAPRTPVVRLASRRAARRWLADLQSNLQ